MKQEPKTGTESAPPKDGPPVATGTEDGDPLEELGDHIAKLPKDKVRELLEYVKGNLRA